MKDLGLRRHDILFKSILLENEKQILKWGIQDHTIAEWLMFLTEEHGELAEAIAEWQFREADPVNIVKEAIQVATLALKIAEMIDYQVIHEEERK